MLHATTPDFLRYPTLSSARSKSRQPTSKSGHLSCRKVLNIRTWPPTVSRCWCCKAAGRSAPIRSVSIKPSISSASTSTGSSARQSAPSMPRSSRAARAPNGCTECAPFGSASNTVMCSTTSCRPYSLRHCATGWRCRQGSQGSLNLGPDDCENPQDCRKPAIQLDKEPAIMVREPHATMQPAPQDNQLLSKHRVLSFKPHLRLEWRGQYGQSETEQPHHSGSLADSITSSPRIRFSVHTRA